MASAALSESEQSDFNDWFKECVEADNIQTTDIPNMAQWLCDHSEKIHDKYRELKGL